MRLSRQVDALVDPEINARAEVRQPGIQAWGDVNHHVATPAIAANYLDIL